MPLKVLFIESSQDLGQTYLWDFGDVNSYNTSNIKNPTHIFEESGVYDITLSVTSADGCTNVDVVEDLIIVYDLPQAKFIAEPEIASVIKPIIDFVNLSSGAVEYHWFFGDGDSSLAKNPYHAYAPREQNYLVELRVTSDKECRDTVYLQVRIQDEYTFYAPTAFSPDGDGINDMFYIKGHGIDASKYKLMVFNRWGEPVFESEDPNESWNGIVKGSNKVCKIGSYTWLAIFKDQAGVEHAETGAVTIIR
jgi:gliding motility-associated-like protein